MRTQLPTKISPESAVLSSGVHYRRKMIRRGPRHHLRQQRLRQVVELFRPFAHQCSRQLRRRNAWTLSRPTQPNIHGDHCRARLQALVAAVTACTHGGLCLQMSQHRRHHRVLARCRQLRHRRPCTIHSFPRMQRGCSISSCKMMLLVQARWVLISMQHHFH